MQRHTDSTYKKTCDAGHAYSSADVAARWKTRKGNPRYWCPTCLQENKRPPKDWKKA